jgi:hypothetical protein
MKQAEANLRDAVGQLINDRRIRGTELATLRSDGEIA